MPRYRLSTHMPQNLPPMNPEDPFKGHRKPGTEPTDTARKCLGLSGAFSVCVKKSRHWVGGSLGLGEGKLGRAGFGEHERIPGVQRIGDADRFGSGDLPCVEGFDAEDPAHEVMFLVCVHQCDGVPVPCRGQGDVRPLRYHGRVRFLGGRL